MKENYNLPFKRSPTRHDSVLSADSAPIEHIWAYFAQSVIISANLSRRVISNLECTLKTFLSFLLSNNHEKLE